MTAIPADVNEAVERMVHESLAWNMSPVDVFREVVARAIMAERERCAKVAEAQHTFRDEKGKVLCVRALPSGAAIAEAIRSGQ